MVSPRTHVRLEASPTACASGEAEGGSAYDAPYEVWHIDTTVIRLLEGSRAYLHAVIDNLSRRILRWHVAGAFAPGNCATVLLAGQSGATSSTRVPVVLADAGVENVNAQIDARLATGVLRRLLAITELKFSEVDDRSLVAIAEASLAVPARAR